MAPPQTATRNRPRIRVAGTVPSHADHPHGVGLPGAVDHTSGKPDTQFYVSPALYDANRKSDRDGDGIACEA